MLKNIGIQSQHSIGDISMRWGNRRKYRKTVGIPIKTEHCWSNCALRELSGMLKNRLNSNNNCTLLIKPCAEGTVGNVENTLEFQLQHSISDITVCWENRRKCWQTSGIPSETEHLWSTYELRELSDMLKPIGIPIQTAHCWSNYVLKEWSEMLKNNLNSNQNWTLLI